MNSFPLGPAATCCWPQAQIRKRCRTLWLYMHISIHSDDVTGLRPSLNQQSKCVTTSSDQPLTTTVVCVTFLHYTSKFATSESFPLCHVVSSLTSTFKVVCFILSQGDGEVPWCYFSHCQCKNYSNCLWFATVQTLKALFVISCVSSHIQPSCQVFCSVGTIEMIWGVLLL